MSHTTRKPLAIALALAAVAAPAAGAAIPHEGGQVSSAGTPTGVERPAPPDRLDAVDAGRSLAATAAVTPPDRFDAVDAGRSLVATAAVTPPDRIDAASQAPVRPIVTDGGTSFDWTDAGIGFAAAAGLALMGAGSLATVRWRRNERTFAQ